MEEFTASIVFLFIEFSKKQVEFCVIFFTFSPRGVDVSNLRGLVRDNCNLIGKQKLEPTPTRATNRDRFS